MLGPTSRPRTSTVLSGQLSASNPKITLAAPVSAAIPLSSTRPRLAPITLVMPPSTMLIPATMASAWIVLPAQAMTTTPAAIHPSPAATAMAGVRASLAAASSLTPVAMKAPATNSTSASSEVNGLSVRTTPMTAHAPPSNGRAHWRVTG